MLSKVLETNQFVVDKAKYVKINYEKANELIKEFATFEKSHYLTKVPYPIYEMNTKDIVNFLLIYDAIDFSFWGEPKWTITTDSKQLDGGMALLHCIFNLFEKRDSVEVYKRLEKMTLEKFKEILKGNVEIPLLEERYKRVIEIVKRVNEKMNSNFYEWIKEMNSDIEIFNTIIENFPCFDDIRTYKNKTIYFYKLAQLLTSDILYVIERKEQKNVDYSNLLGCADYKIPQVMQDLGILEYNKELENKIINKIEIPENSEYEVEIRASMLIVINYIHEKMRGKIDRMDINNFIWNRSQDKTKKTKPYHLTRTTSY